MTLFTNLLFNWVFKSCPQAKVAAARATVAKSLENGAFGPRSVEMTSLKRGVPTGEKLPRRPPT
jgi:hypothetical protein